FIVAEKKNVASSSKNEVFIFFINIGRKQLPEIVTGAYLAKLRTNDTKAERIVRLQVHIASRSGHCLKIENIRRLNISNFSPISTIVLFTGSRRAAVSVINDLVTDNRVQRTCAALRESGYEVTLIGRVLPGSPPLPKWDLKVVRMRMLFRSGPLFYLFFDLRLF